MTPKNAVTDHRIISLLLFIIINSLIESVNKLKPFRAQQSIDLGAEAGLVFSLNMKIFTKHVERVNTTSSPGGMISAINDGFMHGVFEVTIIAYSCTNFKQARRNLR